MESGHRAALEVHDCVGGGHRFASGLIYCLVTTGDLYEAVKYGVAYGALAMTTPDNISMGSLMEVEALTAGTGARVQRLSENGVRL